MKRILQASDVRLGPETQSGDTELGDWENLDSSFDPDEEPDWSTVIRVGLEKEGSTVQEGEQLGMLFEKVKEIEPAAIVFAASQRGYTIIRAFRLKPD